MFEKWVAAERFYTFSMPLVVIFMVIFIGVYLFVLIYTDRGTKASKVGNLIFFSLLLIAVVYSGAGHLSHRNWLSQNDYIHPGIRDRSMILGMETTEDPAIVNAYRRSATLGENLSSLDLYDSELVTRSFPYDYIGSRGNQHYFTYGESDDFVFRMDGLVYFSEDENELIGYEYRLTDERFEEIGFYNEHHVIFEALYLTEEEKEVDTSLAQSPESVTNMIGGWLFGRQFY